MDVLQLIHTLNGGVFMLWLQDEEEPDDELGEDEE